MKNNDFNGVEKIKIYNQYFVHSYAAKFSKEIERNTICVSKYGGHTFSSVVRNKNTVGLQFHPERSGLDGINLLSNIMKSLIKYKSVQ